MVLLSSSLQGKPVSIAIAVHSGRHVESSNRICFECGTSCEISSLLGEIFYRKVCSLTWSYPIFDCSTEGRVGALPPCVAKSCLTTPFSIRYQLAFHPFHSRTSSVTFGIDGAASTAPHRTEPYPCLTMLVATAFEIPVASLVTQNLSSV